MPWPTFKTEDEVPEGFRDEYHEVDGEWVAKADGLGDAGKAALESERTARKAAEKAAKAAADALDALKLEAVAKEGGITDEKLAEIRKAAEAEAAAKYADYEPTKAKLRDLQLDSRVKSLALKNGVRAERVDQWWKLHGDQFDLTEDGTAVVKASPTSDVAKYIAGDLKKALPDFYEGSKGDGSGAAGSHGGAGGSGSITWEQIEKDPTLVLGGVSDQ